MARKRTKAKAGRPPKPPGSTKSQYLQVRVLETEREGFAAAAELNGLDLSAWVRMTLRMAAKKVLKESGDTVPFLDQKK